MVLPGQNGAPGSCVWFGPMAVAWGGFGGCPPPRRGGRGGSGVIHGLGQEQRKIWGFPPLAQSGLWVHGLPGLSRAGSDKGGQDTQAPTGCHRIPQNQGETPERDPDPSPMQATEVCRPARRELSVPVSLTLETSPSPVAWGGWLGGYGGLCGAFGSWRRAAHAHGGRLFPDTPRSGSIRRQPAAATACPRLELPTTATVSEGRHGERGTGMPPGLESRVGEGVGGGGYSSRWFSPLGTQTGSSPSFSLHPQPGAPNVCLLPPGLGVMGCSSLCPHHHLEDAAAPRLPWVGAGAQLGACPHRLGAAARLPPAALR